MKSGWSISVISSAPDHSIWWALVLLEYPVYASSWDSWGRRSILDHYRGFRRPISKKPLVSRSDYVHRTIDDGCDNGLGIILKLTHPAVIARTTDLPCLQVKLNGVSTWPRGVFTIFQHRHVNVEFLTWRNRDYFRNPSGNNMFTRDRCAAAEDAFSGHYCASVPISSICLSIIRPELVGVHGDQPVDRPQESIISAVRHVWRPRTLFIGLSRQVYSGVERY